MFALAGLFVLLFLLEARFPLRLRKRPLVPRLVVNASLSLLTYAVAASVVRPVGLSLAAWTEAQPFGLVYLIALPAAVRFALGFVLMDLTFYYWHLANHRLPVLWRFHNVHHFDPDLDVSTAFRFHAGEVLLSTGFRILQVGLIGPSPLLYTLYEGVFQASTLFHHSNVRLPIRVERLLNTFLVTPRMHGIHHSVVEPETNSNYGVVFPWWDRLHHSLRLNVVSSAVVIGVPAYLAPADNTVWNALAAPFRRQRDYWHWPDNTRPVRLPAETYGTETRLMA